MIDQRQQPDRPNPEAETRVVGSCPRCQYAIVDVTRACPECGCAATIVQAEIESPTFRPWLHRFAMLFVVATFFLLILGGTVTSKGAGLAVPDWPSTFNYNMFLFPPSMWVGNVFWEHTHRLMGSLVGLMAIIMCIWLWQANTRDGVAAHSPPNEAHRPHQVRPWLKGLGVATLVMVIIQGIMGGLRVTQLSTALAVFHGVTAQVFLCMTVLIAAATSRWWVQAQPKSTAHEGAEQASEGASTLLARSLLRPALIALIALFLQLALGATVRHHGAGLAIPDFPLNYGQVVPPLTQDAIETGMIRYADAPDEYATTEHGWYTPFQVAIHWTHRLWAIVAVAAVANLVIRVLVRWRSQERIVIPAIALVVMILLQVALGAAVIWTGRHPEVATGHQTLGALVLATAALIFFRTSRLASRGEGRQRPAAYDPARIAPLRSPSRLGPQGAGA